jgi:hypothetical protein
MGFSTPVVVTKLISIRLPRRRAGHNDARCWQVQQGRVLRKGRGHEQSGGEPALSTQEGATGVFHDQDKVQVVGRAELELGYEVEVEISRLL